MPSGNGQDRDIVAMLAPSWMDPGGAMLRIAVIPCPSNGITTKVGGHAGTTVETCSLLMQVKVVRYLVGGPSILTAEDLARQDDEIARKTDGVMLSSEQSRKRTGILSTCSGMQDAQRYLRLCVSLWAQESQWRTYWFTWVFKGMLFGQ